MFSTRKNRICASLVILSVALFAFSFISLGCASYDTDTSIKHEKAVDKAQQAELGETAEKPAEPAKKNAELAKPPKGMKALNMQDIGMSNMDVDGQFYIERLYPFQVTPVFYMESGSEKHDVFFKDAAIVAGTVLLAQRIVSAIQDKDMDVFVKLSFNREPPFIESRSPVYNFATISLPRCLAKAKELLATGQELTGSVKNDFTGMKAMKIPSVTKGINESVTNLNTAVTEIPKLMDQLGVK